MTNLSFKRTFGKKSIEKFLSFCKHATDYSVQFLEDYEIDTTPDGGTTATNTVVILYFRNAEQAFTFGYEWACKQAGKEENY